MSFEKIQESEMTGKLISELGDVPELTASELKDRFDALAKDVIIPKFNKLVESIGETSAATGIGMEPPDGITSDQNVAAIILALSAVVKENSDNNHSHSNKATLDSITKTAKESYDKIVTLLSSVNSISDIVFDRSDVLITGKAVANYVSKLGGGDMVKATYDQDNDGIVDDASKLGGKEPGYYQKANDSSLETKNKTVISAVNEVNSIARHTYETICDVEFSEDSDYRYGEYVYHNGDLYRFTDNHFPGEWDDSQVERIILSREFFNLPRLKSDDFSIKLNANEMISTVETGILTSKVVGVCFVYNDVLYYYPQVTLSIDDDSVSGNIVIKAHNAVNAVREYRVRVAYYK